MKYKSLENEDICTCFWCGDECCKSDCRQSNSGEQGMKRLIFLIIVPAFVLVSANAKAGVLHRLSGNTGLVLQDSRGKQVAGVISVDTQ